MIALCCREEAAVHDRLERPFRPDPCLGRVPDAPLLQLVGDPVPDVAADVLLVDQDLRFLDAFFRQKRTSFGSHGGSERALCLNSRGASEAVEPVFQVRESPPWIARRAQRAGMTPFVVARLRMSAVSAGADWNGKKCGLGHFGDDPAQ